MSGNLDIHDGLFAQLLKPIKDLAENWTVELASILEQYTEQIHNTQISFDGGVTTMNFSEAAMILQSSTCVYSKKVEYLYSLVYQVLNQVSSKEKKGQKSSVDGEGEDADADFAATDDDEEFLSLDDITNKKDWIKAEDFDAHEKFQLYPKVPLCMLPKEGDDKGENPLLSKSGEVLASLNDFKIYTSQIHASGMLYIDKSYLELVEQTMKGQPLGEGMDVAEDLMQPDVRNDADDYEDMPALEDFGESSEPDLNIPEANMDDQTIVGTDAAAQMSGRPRRENIVEKAQPDPQPVKKDIYEQLDSHEDLGKKKPFKKSTKCQKQLPGMGTESKKRKKTNTRFCHELLRIDKYIYMTSFSKLTNGPKSERENEPLEEQYWQEKKKREARLKEWLKQMEKMKHLSKEWYWQEKKEGEVRMKEWLEQRRVDRLTEARNADENEVEEEEVVLNQDNGDNEDDSNDFDMEVPQVDDRLFDDAEILRGGDMLGHEMDRDDYQPTNGESYEDMVQRYVRQMKQITKWKFIKIVFMYNLEEKILKLKEKKEQYLAGAQDFIQVTELSKRVSDWEDKILPRLQEEDMHEPFDINKYGSLVLDNLLKGKSVWFWKLVTGKQPYEICRIFLSMLMLANTGNVKIDGNEGQLDKIMDKFGLELLSTRRHFEDLQEYQAPSLGNS